jgi:transcription initiation factor TFIID subunit 2
VPRPPKVKRSKIVKLRLRPELLQRFTNEKKRKLQVADSERPHKRQSQEPIGGSSRKNGLVTVDKRGGDRPRLMVKIKVGRKNLPA